MNDGEPTRPRVALSFADLAEFCGRQRPSAVKKWLQRERIPYLLDADGRPCTTVNAIDDVLFRRRRTEPNWEVLRSLGRKKRGRQGA